MKERNIDRTIKECNCIEGGTKEACLKVHETLSHSIVRGDNFCAPLSEVSMREFLQAVRVLVAFASKVPDEKVELYYCEGDCVRYRQGPCPYDVMLSTYATKVCPHYIEEDK